MMVIMDNRCCSLTNENRRKLAEIILMVRSRNVSDFLDRLELAWKIADAMSFFPSNDLRRFAANAFCAIRCSMFFSLSISLF